MGHEPFQLPSSLLNCLADSELEVVSWSGDVLTLKIVKEIGDEVGLLQFEGVSQVCLPPKLQLGGLRVGSNEATIPGLIADRPLDPDDHAFIFQGSWGGEFFVVAQTARYFLQH